MDSLVNELVYRNYRFNREQSPETPPQQWAQVFGARSEQLEERYQMELTTDGTPGDVQSFLAEKRYEEDLVEECRAIVEGRSQAQITREHLRVLLSWLDGPATCSSEEAMRLFPAPF